MHNDRFLGSALNKLPIIKSVTDQDYCRPKTDYQHNASFNHLICNIFCVVSLKEDNAPLFILESPIFAKEHKDILKGEYYYNFSIGKPYIIKSESIICPSYANNGKLIADFVSDHPSNTQVGYITKERLIPITKPDAGKRTLEAVDHHGDQVALYTLKTNKNLFFKLITKHGHRSNYKIQAFGCRYFSSYDACETCNDTIYSTRNSIRTELDNILPLEGYNKFSPTEPVPFYNLFYSYNPYYGKGEVKYSLLNRDCTLYKEDLVYKELTSSSNGLESKFTQANFNMPLTNDWIFSNVETFNSK